MSVSMCSTDKAHTRISRFPSTLVLALYHYLVTPDNAFDYFSSVHSPIDHLISPIDHLINLIDHLISSIDHLITWLRQIMLILHALFFKLPHLHPQSNIYTLFSHLLTAFSTSSMFTSLGTCLSQNFWLLVLTLSHENKNHGVLVLPECGTSDLFELQKEKHSLIKHYNKTLCSSFN